MNDTEHPEQRDCQENCRFVPRGLADATDVPLAGALQQDLP